MKKIQIVLIMGILISIMITNANAQSGVNNIAKNEEHLFTANAIGRTTGHSKAKLSKAYTRAFSDFKKSFKNEQDAKWAVEVYAIIATFKKDDVQTKIIYDRKGRWLHTIKVYDEEKMPEDIRASVKRSVYYDYDITKVFQIEKDRKTFYIINLKNGRKFIQISVYDQELNILQQFDLAI